MAQKKTAGLLLYKLIGGLEYDVPAVARVCAQDLLAENVLNHLSARYVKRFEHAMKVDKCDSS